MAERVREGATTPVTPRSRAIAAVPAAQRFPIERFWSRESLLRLGLSFVLALALWLYITSKQSANPAIDYPTALQAHAINSPPELLVANTLPPVRIKYRLDNPGMQVSSASLRPVIDLVGLGPGVHRHVPITIEADPGLNVASYAPRFAVVA